MAHLSFSAIILLYSIFNGNNATVTHPSVPSNCSVGSRTRYFSRVGTILGQVDNKLVTTCTSNLSAAANQFFIKTSGLYLISESVPENGIIVQVKAFGYLSEESLAQSLRSESPPIPHLFIVVFREEVGSGLYQLIHGPKELTHTVTPGELPREGEMLDLPVQRGDRIGALIPSGCKNKTELYNCPSQINLVTDPAACLSTLYYPFHTDMDFEDLISIPDELRNIPTDQFEEVQVKLNMEVLIFINESTDELLLKTLPVVMVTIILSALVVVVIAILCYILMRQRKQLKRQLLAAQKIEVPLENMCSNGPMPAEFGRSLDTTIAATNNAYQEMPPVDLPNSLDGGYSVEELSEDDATNTSLIETGIPTSNDGYALLGNETPEEAISTPLHDTSSNSRDGYVVDSGYEYDYHEPFFAPANKEEELVMQLGMKLAVTDIPRQDLELCEVLGSGAFGTVYKGVWSHSEVDSDQVVKEEVAVKTIDREVSESDKIKFLQEATIMAQFKHCNIVRIKGVLMESPVYYFAD